MLRPPLTSTAKTVLARRYFAAGEDWDGLSRRVCMNIAEAEQGVVERQKEYKAFMRSSTPGSSSPTLPR